MFRPTTSPEQANRPRLAARSEREHGGEVRQQSPSLLTAGGLTWRLLITHDMAVIRQACDRVLVLDQGRAVELGTVWQVFAEPQAAATLALLRPLRLDLPVPAGGEFANAMHAADAANAANASYARARADIEMEAYVTANG